MKKYTIKKGNHYSGFRFVPHFGITMESYIVYFTESCLYEGNATDDTNKLAGWTYGWNPHYNSIRTGWKPVLGKILLSLYIYCKGERIIGDLCSVDINIPYHIILFKDHVQVLDVGTGSVINNVRFNFGFKPTWGYKLHPYFGGDNPAPHDVTIYLSRI